MTHPILDYRQPGREPRPPVFRTALTFTAGVLGGATVVTVADAVVRQRALGVPYSHSLEPADAAVGIVFFPMLAGWLVWFGLAVREATAQGPLRSRSAVFAAAAGALHPVPLLVLSWARIGVMMPLGGGWRLAGLVWLFGYPVVSGFCLLRRRPRGGMA